MHEISDEMIMAWVDGELDPVEQRLVESYLKQNPAAAERVARFASTGRDLAKMFDQPMREPVPAHLIDAVRNMPSHTPSTSWRATLDALRTAYAPWMPAAAFATVLILGGTIWTTHQNPRLQAGVTLASASLQRVLDMAPSGTDVALGPQDPTVRVTPVSTFVTKTGHYCREFERVLSPAQAIAAVGCRRDDGKWQIEIEAQTTPVPRRTGIAPVGRKPVAAINAVVGRLISGDALDPQPEAELIAKQWRREK